MIKVRRWARDAYYPREPFRDLVSTHDHFNQLFNETFARAFGDQKKAWLQTWVPPVDICETESSLVLKAELPGINPDDVEIRVEGGTLYLKGERKFEKDAKEENLHRVERPYGTFTRSFSLPNSIDSDRVKAEYQDGVLTLTMPKREAAKPKSIKIAVSKA
ncbi:MAG TPA: Hsp20/alpha crystallin family protein [Terriglobia bacterium]|nr:Hsp20/alpha crystallin family protein [Terriglobia bacterium]